MTEPQKDETGRIITLRLSSMQGPVNLVCNYAPTLQASSEIRNQFYESLDTTSIISKLPDAKYIYLLIDLPK